VVRLLEEAQRPTGLRGWGDQLHDRALLPSQLWADLEQVLNDANYAKAREGMDRNQIRRLLGKPANIMVFDNLREEVWEWKIEGMPHTELTWFNVYFDTGSGRVKKAGKRVEVRG
jgi:uncharacterized protein (DUF2126 family)